MRLLLLLTTATLWAGSGFQYRDVTPLSLELSEDGKPVFVYNHGLMKKEGVPEDRYRSSYVHPLYTPDGVVLTDDFPRDHYHHRGIFWTWPIVRVDGRQYDPWAIKGIHQKFERWIARDAGERSARLGVENGWYTTQGKVAKETVEILTRPASSGRREIEFILRFDALDQPVELEGDPTNDKGYGGFCVRFAPREQTTIATDKGREARDTDMVSHPWAQLMATYQGRRAGLRIDIDPSNPGYPNGWCLRHYGFLGVNYPGRHTHTLKPGEPLLLKYKVTVFSAEPGR